MSAIRRSRVLAVSPQQLWRTVADPRTLPQWWPGVERVEGVKSHGFTQVLRSERGAVVRADYLRTQSVEPELLVWTQHIEGTPFASVFAARAVQITLAPTGVGAVKVTLSVEQTLRGAARFVPLNRGGVRRQLDAALEALEALGA